MTIKRVSIGWDLYDDNSIFMGRIFLLLTIEGILERIKKNKRVRVNIRYLEFYGIFEDENVLK